MQSWKMARSGSIAVLALGQWLVWCLSGLADTADLTEVVPFLDACTGYTTPVPVDLGDGTMTLMMLNTLDGEAYETPAAYPGYGREDYWFTGFGCTGHPNGPGHFSIWFVDPTRGYDPMHPEMWTLKSVKGVHLDFFCNDALIDPMNPHPYLKVDAYTEQFNGGTRIGSYTRGFGDSSELHCEFLPACGAEGVKEIFIHTDFAENALQSLVVHSDCAPAMIPVLPVPLTNASVFRYHTLFGLEHLLQRRGSFSPYMLDWAPIHTNPAGMAGIMEFADPLPENSTNQVTRFYRVAAIVPPSAKTPIPPHATWRYLDNGSDQGTAWRQVNFDDGNWKSGPAKLGYGKGDEATVLSYGPNPTNRYITTYFRRSFQIDSPTNYTGLLLELQRDDGAIVYLNGNEVFRSNMPTGVVDYLTLAASQTTGADETNFFATTVSSNLLVSGNNVIAVEVHQDSAISDDLCFALQLTEMNLGPFAPTIYQQPQSQQVSTGKTADFSVLATGTPPLSYQWYYQNVPLAGVTVNVFSISNVMATNAGTYSVQVLNATGSKLSDAATLTVLP
ncbi:MAG TPA: immunoglobulin domain-containing protein [Candidatus Acidoferrum sp.]|nr:immunoglobulin domain-containing protein [Candidatus Acidoferrum sp.]